MKLWFIHQDHNNGYDTYDSAVVAAETENDARHMDPYGDVWNDETKVYGDKSYGISCWAAPSYVNARLIGEAVPGTERGVICASFNAG